MAKIYTATREFDAESEPVMGAHEAFILSIIADKAPVSREDIVKALNEAKESDTLKSNQDSSGLLSFHQRSLRLRGLIAVEVTKSDAAARARKATLSMKEYTKLRDYDAETEPKMSPSEVLIFGFITEAGVLRANLVESIQEEIDAGNCKTAQTATGLLSATQGNLNKRGLVAITTVEVERPEEVVEDIAEVA